MKTPRKVKRRRECNRRNCRNLTHKKHAGATLCYKHLKAARAARVVATTHFHSLLNSWARATLAREGRA